MNILHLLRRVSLPYARRHIGLTLMTATGVALGVAVWVAIQLASTSLEAALHATVDRVAGKAHLQVTAGEVGFPEEAVEIVRATPGIKAAAPVVEAVVRSEQASEGNLLVLGVDLAGDRKLRDYEFEDDEESIEDPLVFLAQPDSICLSADFAARNGLELDDEISFETVMGVKDFTIRGLLEPRGFATAFGGNLALMDVYAAQFIFNRGRRFDRIDVLLEDGLSQEAGAATLKTALGPGFTVEPPFRRGAEMESLLEAFSASMDLSCWQALFIGVFLIFNIFAVAVTRRRFEIGVLRSLGAGPVTIRWVFLAEGAVLGLIGSLAGLALGMFLARGTTQFMKGLVMSAYGLTHVTAEVTWSPWVLVIGGVLGIGSSLLAAWIPARAASAVDPVEALARTGAQHYRPAEVRWRRWAGLAAVALAVAVRLQAAREAQYLWAVASLASTGLAALLLAPGITRMASRMLRPFMARFGGLEGRLASDSLLTSPRRTSATVAALMLSVAFGISQAGYATAFGHSFDRWLEQALSADFYVTGTERFISKAFQFPASYGDEMARVQDVRHVERVRAVRQRYRGEMITLLALEAGKFLDRSRLWVVEGNPDEVAADLRSGAGITISNNFSTRYGVSAGDTVTLETPTGPATFPVAGVIVDYSSEKGTIYIDRELFISHWRDTTVDTFDLMLEPGADAVAVKKQVLELFGDRGTRLFVFTGAEFKARIGQISDQFFGLVYVQFSISLLVAILGIVNSLLISVTERRREIGIFKAMGAGRRQVVRLIVLEAVGIGVAGTVLGLILGSYLIDVAVNVLGASLNGWPLPYIYPFPVAAAALPLLILVAMAAAWYPARVALSTTAVEALAYE